MKKKIKTPMKENKKENRDISPYAKEINDTFDFHPPSVDDPGKFTLVRESARSFALLLEKLIPDSRERALAVTKIKEAAMWASLGIAKSSSTK